MRTSVHRRSASRAVAFILGVGIFPGSPAMADDAPVASQRDSKWARIFPRRKPTSQGTLGYGAPGPHAGFPGFGLGYHPGYGYGGAALGVGAEGGYPSYGGPGYPHPAPALRRLGPIAPFCYDGGPGGPVPGQPNFFEGTGPLAPDQPVVTFANDSPEFDYGCFNGSIPYPESTFAPFTSMIGGTTTERNPPTPPTPPSTPPPARSVPEPTDASGILGIEMEAVVDATQAKGLKVTRVRPASPADQAGLKVGDVIRSTNGYLAEQPGNLTWVVLNAKPGDVLTFNVLAARDGEVRTLTTRRP